MKKLVFTCLICCMLCPFKGFGLKPIKKKKKNILKTQKNFLQKTGIIKDINNKHLSIYMLNGSVAIFKISNNCRIRGRKENISEYKEQQYLSMKNFLNKGYKVTIFVDPKDKLVKLIYIKEIPQ
ncbi:hypothetical protein [Desulfothermus sp.]